ncbi:MAG: alpha/beta hydrolase [Lachnospiraceae bacterium]|nr:alpha/beta hydrolase [Lachnospiraceae bacterium]MBP1586310.1 alpha/beta hydrolase [Lachnospiraceae bacterium]
MDICVEGLKIAYKFTGEGDTTAVILQGWGTSYPLYDVVASSISSKYRVLQFDLPGFGASDEPPESWNVDQFTDFFIKLMEALEIKKTVLIGHSYGGRMVIKLVARDNIPFEIEKIVLIDSAGVMPKRSASQKFRIWRYKCLKKFLNLKPVYMMFGELIDLWKSSQGSEDYRNASPVMKGCLVKAVNEDLCHLFEKNRYDTLLVWGDKDDATPISDARIMEKLMPSAGLAIIPGTGHFSFAENVPVFTGIMQAYLEI